MATTLLAPEGTDGRDLVAHAQAVPSSRRLAPVTASSRAPSSGSTTPASRARLSIVLEALEALGIALEGSARPRGSVQDALDAAERAWSAEESASP